MKAGCSPAGFAWRANQIAIVVAISIGRIK